MDERPGNVKIGLITLVSKAPKNSKRPKFNNKGNNNPAKKNIVNKIVSRPFNTKAPVESLIIASGPTLNSAKTQNTAPIILVTNHIGFILNKVFKNSLFIIKLGLNTFVIMLIITDIQTEVAIIGVSHSPRALARNLDNIATGIVISPLKLTGIMNKSIPINDGIIKNNDDFIEKSPFFNLFIPISFMSKILIFIQRILF
ncbi:hypothetical protein UT300007_25470 [Clostridium sp. CTA-7]